MAPAVKASEFEWEKTECDGTEAYPEIAGEDYEIVITGRERPQTAYYSVSRPNQRSWTVGVYGGREIGSGEADGIRECKKEALEALNAYLATR